MTEILTGVFDLFSQLIEIGNEHPEVLIATLALIVGAAVTVVLFCVAVVVAMPFLLVRGIIGFFQWLYYLRHPEKRYYWDEEEDEEEPPKRESKRKKNKGKQEVDPIDDPVLPHWLNQKGGRLL